MQIQKIIMSQGTSSGNDVPNFPSQGDAKQSRRLDTDTEPFDIWEMVINSSPVKKLLVDAQQSDLPQKLAAYVGDQEMETGEGESFPYIQGELLFNFFFLYIISL